MNSLFWLLQAQWIANILRFRFQRTIQFCRELKQSIPNAEFRWRNRSRIKKTVQQAVERGYSDIAVINEDRRHPS